VFNAEPVTPLDGKGPVLIHDLTEGEVVSGIVSRELSITDNIRVASAEFTVNSQTHNLDNLPNPILVFDSNEFSDGDTSLVVSATDYFGNVTQESISIRIANHSPIIKLLSSPMVNSSAYDIAFSVDANDIVIDKLIVNGQVIEYEDLGRVESSQVLALGKNSLVIKVIDINALEYDFNYSIGYDNASPLISVTSPGINAPKVFNSNGELEVWQPIQLSNQVINITRDTKALNGMAQSHQTLSDAHFGFVEFTVADPISNQVGTASDTLQVTVSYFKNNAAVFSAKPVENNNGYVIFALADENLNLDWADHPSALNQSLDFLVSDEAGNTATYVLDYLALLKSLDTSNTLVSERFYNEMVNVDLLGDLTETTRASLIIGSQTSNLDDTQISNQLALNTNSLIDGRYEAKVSITGLFENTESENTYINIDNTAPVIGDLSYSEYVNADSTIIKGKAVDAGIGTVALSLNDVPQYFEADGSFELITQLGSEDKSYNITLKATDDFNQTASKIITITRDIVQPFLSINDGLSNEWSKLTSRTVDGLCSDAGSGVTEVYTTINDVTVKSPCDGNNQYEAKFDNIADGIHSIDVTTKDAAGNTQEVSGMVMVDTEQPGISIDDIGGWTSERTQTITGTCSDDRSGVKNIQLILDNGQEVRNSSETITCSPEGEFSHSFNLLTAGIHTVTAIIVDEAENETTATATDRLKIDLSGPQITGGFRKDVRCSIIGVSSCTASFTFEFSVEDIETGISRIYGVMHDEGCTQSGLSITCTATIPANNCNGSTEVSAWFRADNNVGLMSSRSTILRVLASC